MWTIYVTNDNCPDYTWGYTEKQTRKAFADIVRGHLDEMKRTDGWAEADRDRYNMAVTQEALCFVEHYPERKDELIRRIREGRVYVSPYLCNSLWAFQGVEGALRTFYPARRLERDWGISFEVAEHIEEPSLPWGVASILAGCGIRWLSVPFYKYDSTFTGLRNPPAFAFEGPDGETIRVVMDPWACGRHSYMQGARLLRGGQAAASQWVAHYARMGKDYPARAILASGTHGDISPASGGQARQYAEAIRKHNARPAGGPRLVNAALPQFCTAIDAAHAHAPFLQTIRGSFGHSWDLWPVCLAKYAADMREGARRMLAAEALLALAAHRRPDLYQATRADRERAEWCWAMLSDHAWNGTNDRNKRHNADLRRDWGRELNRIAGELTRRGWAALGIRPAGDGVALFNSLSLARRGPVRVDAAAGGVAAFSRDAELPSQVVREDGTSRLYFLSPEVAGFGVEQVSLRAGPRPKPGAGRLHATPQRLESPYYRLRLDPKTGGFASVVHKPTGAELVAPGSRRRLCQTIYYTDREHVLEDVRSEVTAAGPVLARLRVTGRVHGIDVTNCVTVYGELDRVDFRLRLVARRGHAVGRGGGSAAPADRRPAVRDGRPRAGHRHVPQAGRRPGGRLYPAPVGDGGTIRPGAHRREGLRHGRAHRPARARPEGAGSRGRRREARTQGPRLRSRPPSALKARAGRRARFRGFGETPPPAQTTAGPRCRASRPGSHLLDQVPTGRSTAPPADQATQRAGAQQAQCHGLGNGDRPVGDVRHVLGIAEVAPAAGVAVGKNQLPRPIEDARGVHVDGSDEARGRLGAGLRHHFATLEVAVAVRIARVLVRIVLALVVVGEDGPGHQAVHRIDVRSGARVGDAPAADRHDLAVQVHADDGISARDVNVDRLHRGVFVEQMVADDDDGHGQRAGGAEKQQHGADNTGSELHLPILASGDPRSSDNLSSICTPGRPNCQVPSARPFAA